MKAFRRPGLALGAAVVLTAVATASSPASTPAPVLMHSAVISRISGHIAFKLPSSSKFAALGSAPATIPFGATIDASHGIVQVTIATATAGATATALFYTGEFAITQNANGIAELTLNGPLKPCPNATTLYDGNRNTSHAAKGPSAKRPKTRSLWGDGGSGQFTTKGNYAAATVLGTLWLTTDSCASTVVSVAEGTVSVTDLVTNAASTVTTGQAFAVQSTGTTTVAPFSGPAANGYAVAISASNRAVKLGKRYSLTATGTAGGSGDAYIYENVGAPCSPTLAAEQSNSVAHEFGNKTLTAAGPFSLTVPALAKHTGTKYYCAYLTNPAAYSQVIVTVSA